MKKLLVFGIFLLCCACGSSGRIQCSKAIQSICENEYGHCVVLLDSGIVCSSEDEVVLVADTVCGYTSKYGNTCRRCICH